MDTLWLLCALLAGLNAGILVSGVFESVYMRDVSLSGYLQMHQPRDLVLRRVMPPLLVLLMLACVILGLTRFGQVSGTLAWAAFALVLVDVLVTVRMMVPLNIQLQTFDSLRPPAQAQDVRRRWYAVHPLRTGLGVLAFVLLLLAGVV